MDGYSYDSSGNLLNDGSKTYSYDAESRIHTVTNGSVVTTYVYDAAGRRVRKTVGSVTTDYLYNLAGQAVTEINGSGAWTRGEVFVGGKHLATYVSGTTYFNHADWLGTERVRSDINGAACETITSLIFGDGMATSGTCGDQSTRHFTGKEHDDETNLDDFGERYYSSQFGRFVSADWSDVPVAVPYADLTNPQRLNLYALVHDNPSTFADLDGHMAPGQLGFSGGMGITPRMRGGNGNAYGCVETGCDSYLTLWELKLDYGNGQVTIEYFDSESQAEAAQAQINTPGSQQSSITIVITHGSYGGMTIADHAGAVIVAHNDTIIYDPGGSFQTDEVPHSGTGGVMTHSDDGVTIGKYIEYERKGRVLCNNL